MGDTNTQERRPEAGRIDMDTRLAMYRSIVEIRTFEKRAYDLFLQNLVKGTSHLSLGMEAISAGFGAAMLLTSGLRLRRSQSMPSLSGA